MEDVILRILTDYGILGALVLVLGYFMKGQVDSMKLSNKEQGDMITTLFEESKEENSRLESDYREYLKKTVENNAALLDTLSRTITENSMIIKANTETFEKLISQLSK